MTLNFFRAVPKRAGTQSREPVRRCRGEGLLTANFSRYGIGAVFDWKGFAMDGCLQNPAKP